MNKKLGWKIMTEFAALGSKPYSFLTDDSDENKKSERYTKKCC